MQQGRLRPSSRGRSGIIPTCFIRRRARLCARPDARIPDTPTERPHEHQIRPLDPRNGREARHDRALRARPGPFRRRRRVVSYGTSSYGYDVRCAREFKVFTNINSAIVDPKAFDPQSFVDIESDVCIIPPNSFALARTVEYFRIPRDILTICLGKSTYARCGIIVNVTPAGARMGRPRNA